jgi:nicotinamidase-related amidase
LPEAWPNRLCEKRVGKKGIEHRSIVPDQTALLIVDVQHATYDARHAPGRPEFHVAKDGADHGFYMNCVHDACTAETEARHAAALRRFQDFCRMTTDQVLMLVN